MTPFFSVVIPLYNKEAFIETTIKSVLNQTFKDYEIIIINDGSTDKSLDIVKKINSNNISVYNNKNNGLSFSRNFGIKRSQANFIAFLDADDIWADNYLETIYNLVQLNKSNFVFATRTKVLKPKNNLSVSHKEFNAFFAKPISNHSLFRKYLLNFSAIVIHKNVFDNVGYFKENINYGEDEDFAIRCFTNYELIYYNDPKAFYRQGFTNQLTTPNPNFKKQIPNFDSYLNEENKLVLKPYIDFIHYKLMVLFKMEKNSRLVKFYKQKIEVKNLNIFQKIKYYLPIEVFYYCKQIYIWFSKRLNHC
ncbi:MAG: glycosyltransferase [Flaviramulus sp.]|nr:glycosyltransferase [Flaviramulus sp.]NNC51085.1 glycosyltransferase [Flaviramulus sp.]